MSKAIISYLNEDKRVNGKIINTNIPESKYPSTAEFTHYTSKGEAINLKAVHTNDTLSLFHGELFVTDLDPETRTIFPEVGLEINHK